jgi:hypothetical protein
LTLGILNSVTLLAVTSVFAQEQKFNSKLTGQGEVPPKITDATGTAFFSLRCSIFVGYVPNFENDV